MATKLISVNGNVVPYNGKLLVISTPNNGAGSSSPVEVATEAEMTALLVAENVGKVYKFTGTTGTYDNGEIYIVEVSE